MASDGKHFCVLELFSFAHIGHLSGFKVLFAIGYVTAFETWKAAMCQALHLGWVGSRTMDSSVGWLGWAGLGWTGLGWGHGVHECAALWHLVSASGPLLDKWDRKLTYSNRLWLVQSVCWVLVQLLAERHWDCRPYRCPYRWLPACSSPRLRTQWAVKASCAFQHVGRFFQVKFDVYKRTVWEVCLVTIYAFSTNSSWLQSSVQEKCAMKLD